jgi:Flp pilus assembly protein TadD
LTLWTAQERYSPKEPTILINRGRALAARGLLEEALESYRRASAVAPGDTEVVLETAKTLNRLGRPAEALPLLGSAARLSCHDPRIFVEIGVTFAALDDLVKAEQAYRFAIQADPQFGPAYLNLGAILDQSNRVGELGELLEEADRRGVRGGEVDFLRAQHLRRQGKMKEALEYAQRAESEALDDVLRWQLIGQVADRLGQEDFAFAEFQQMNLEAGRDPASATFDGTEHRRYVELVDQCVRGLSVSRLVGDTYGFEPELKFALRPVGDQCLELRARRHVHVGKRGPFNLKYLLSGVDDQPPIFPARQVLAEKLR